MLGFPDPEKGRNLSGVAENIQPVSTAKYRPWIHMDRTGYRTMDRSGSIALSRSKLANFFFNHGGNLFNQYIYLLIVLSLDHHPHQRLGSRGTEQHTASFCQL